MNHLFIALLKYISTTQISHANAFYNRVTFSLSNMVGNVIHENCVFFCFAQLMQLNSSGNICDKNGTQKFLRSSDYYPSAHYILLFFFRDPRGFAVKFYTEEGIWDLVGNNTPIFFIKDPLFFPSFIHTQKRNPATHLKVQIYNYYL